MDIRCKLRDRLEYAPIEQRAGFYQSRYHGEFFGQAVRLLQICTRHGCTTDTCRERFADYKGKVLFDAASVVEKLCEYDVISFDVFDTLLKRFVRHPADVFRRIEKTMDIPGFAGLRVEAEKAARQYKFRQCGVFEITIEEIYQMMDLYAGYTGVSAEQEIEMEMCCCYADPVMQKIVRSLHREGKKVIAVSDMYLHKKQILELLFHCGYTDIRDLYVSCDYGVSKSDGKLFPLVKQEIGKKRKIVHIGDNFYADVYRQKGLDMGTLHYLKQESAYILKKKEV